MLTVMPPPSDLMPRQREEIHLWLCRHLEAARAKVGARQSDVAAASGVTQNTIVSIERRGRGEEPMPVKPPHSRICVSLDRWAKKSLGFGSAGCVKRPCAICRAPRRSPVSSVKSPTA